jgi:hypothetical protein
MLIQGKLVKDPTCQAKRTTVATNTKIDFEKENPELLFSCLPSEFATCPRVGKMKWIKFTILKVKGL